MSEPKEVEVWEYMVLGFQGGDRNHAEAVLTEHGKRGWELVAVAVQFTTHTFYLKRRVYRENQAKGAY